MKTARITKSIASVLVGAVVALTAVPAYAGCVVSFVESNIARLVTGSLYQECTPPRAPFGDWGVDSNHGSRYDGEQFMGWANVEGHVEWNTCTQAGGGYEAPNCFYYNWSSCTAQWSQPERVYATFVSDVLDFECIEQGGIFTVGNLFMNIYELDDFFGGDDFVTTMEFSGTSDVVLSCDGNGVCSGTSDWIPSSSSSPYIGSSFIRVFVQLTPA